MVVVQFEYDYEAVFKVLTTRGGNHLRTLAVVLLSLNLNETVESTIIIVPYDPADPGC